MKKKIFSIIIVVSILFLFYYFKIKNKNPDNKKVILLFNWGEYIEPSIIKKYNEKSDKFIIKQSFFSSNELAVNKIKAGNQYDIAILSEYAIEQLKDNHLEKIDTKFLNLPKINKNFLTLQEKIDKEIFDFTIPYFYGNLGLLYRKDKFYKEDKENKEKLSSSKWKDLIMDSKYKIALYNNAFEGIFIGLKAINKDISLNLEQDIQEAKKWLIDLKIKNINLSFITDQLLDRMKIEQNEYYDIAVAYSGDARYLMKQNQNLEYYPFTDEGTNIWFDGLVLPKESQKEGAYDFINFLLKDENRKKNNNFINYDSPYDEQNDEQIKKNNPLELKIIEKDKIYKYNKTYKKQISDAWNEIYSYPDPKDKYLIILGLIILFLFLLIYIFINI
ncbi:Spermidine/putrescine import ABC transporter, extracellular solute-binding protein [Candidatus Phytoplasma rubi]|uniref:Spermidine/putrescine import ABC transporter, extracellular solute-binding protein n=1 Tax=Candidatus Phytoplasma rubi TaxID=399025 RepID=A0ABY7BT81_9MOLU|nr:extracellular solute-binding protein [Candidatus Phytoplasma rubi]WAN63277.1 Spermidine/putrescine import ABC transporter, extracellular solute-binding protein [Candidatus Phytoplasma rubi]